MRLKRLEIKGFKSFMDKAALEFAPGLSALVGPNGSGKSNLLDALVWVLGEQKASAMRAEAGAEVIFGGASGARAAGLAEVTLVVDNTDRKLTLPHDEVEVTRRLFRSGDSEYWLGGKKARLRDIRDLFLDTGAGKEAYSLVNQQQVDAVLSLRGDDRRRLIEEAAHVSRYRARRQEAWQKLQRTEQNLLRAGDLQAELSERIESLREPAVTARSYRDLKRQLDAVEQAVIVAQMLGRQQNLRELDTELAGRASDLTKLQAERLELDERAAKLAQEGREAEEQLTSEQERLRRLSSEQSRLDTEIALAEQQKEFAERRLQETATRQDEPERRLAELEERGRKEQQELDEAERKAQIAGERHETALESERSALGLLARKRTALLELQQQRAGLLSKQASLEGQVERTSAEVEALERESTGLEERLRTLTAELAEAQEQTKQAQRDKAEAAEAVRKQEAQVSALEASEKTASLANSEANTALTRLERELIELRARLTALEELDASHEGVARPARELISALDGELSGKLRLLVDLFELPAEAPEWLIALLASLESMVVAEDAPVAALAHTLLAERQVGLATLVWSDGASAGPAGQTLAELVTPGKDALALLKAIPVVETAAEAGKLATKGAWPLVLAKQGGVFFSPRAAAVGAGKLQPTSPMARKAEAGRLKQAGKALEGRVEEARKTQAASLERLETARGELANARASLGEQRTLARETERALQQAEQDYARSERELKVLKQRSSEMATSLGRKREELSRHSEAREKTQHTLDELTKQEPVRSQAIERAEEEAEVAQTATGEARLVLERAKMAHRTVEQDAQRTAGTLQRLRDQIAREKQLHLETAAELASLTQQLSILEPQRRGLAAQLETQEHRVEQLITVRGEARARLAEQESGRRLVGQQLAEVEAEVHKLEMNRLRLESQLEALDQRLYERFEITLAQLPNPEQVADERQATISEVDRLRKELRSLGEVNLGAIQELDECEAHYNSRQKQIDDLLEAKQSLAQMINEIDETSARQFAETLEQVASAFQRRFEDVFGGGKAELVLEEPDNLLESGVTLKAQPPGKKMQSLELLSGGERALVALAFLFALLEVNPAPFCLLDEVDAPLDEVNVKKFLALLDRFKEETQFMVVTHNPVTMKAADALYGVAMEDPGRSKLLSYRMPKRELAAQD